MYHFVENHCQDHGQQDAANVAFFGQPKTRRFHQKLKYLG